MTTPSSVPTMWVLSMDAFLSHWFARYDEARAYRDTDGGYLFPFGGHYFVTTAPAVRQLGLGPTDPDRQAIRFDWARPAHSQAWEPFKIPREIVSLALRGGL